MVQVDVFWSYAFGGALAAAAGPKLAKKSEPFFGPELAKAVLFLALAWAPTGMLLLLRHPSWETMQAASSLAVLPPWLVLAFGITNITQGLLGYAVGRAFLRRGMPYAAEVNWLFGYVGFYFILVYGWDGLGYDRFLYDRDMVAGSPAWAPGVATGATPSGVLRALGAFFSSTVALSLYEDGVWLLPPFFYLYTKWIRERCPVYRQPSVVSLVAAHLRNVFVLGLGSAIVLAFVVGGVALLFGVPSNLLRAQGLVEPRTAAHVASYFIGIPLGLALLWLTLLAPGRALHGWLAAPRTRPALADEAPLGAAAPQG